MSKIDLKVVLLGKEYCGKTSLVERFLYDTFRGNNPYQNTIGAAFGAKKFEVAGDVVTIGLWDTAGSERYESISRIYYRGAHAAIICYDLSDSNSFDRAKFWVSEIKDKEPDCRLYLCGTKNDLIASDRKLRQVDYHNTTDYADEIHAEVVETSSKTGKGVYELFYKIAEDYLKTKVVVETGNGLDLLYVEEKKTGCC